MSPPKQNHDKSKALQFRHIHLENWRNFVRTDVDLQRRVFLVGPNASGKSNFLDAKDGGRSLKLSPIALHLRTSNGLSDR